MITLRGMQGRSLLGERSDAMVGGLGGWWGSLWELEFLVEYLVALEGVV